MKPEPFEIQDGHFYRGQTRRGIFFVRRISNNSGADFLCLPVSEPWANQWFRCGIGGYEVRNGELLEGLDEEVDCSEVNGVWNQKIYDLRCELSRERHRRQDAESMRFDVSSGGWRRLDQVTRGR